MPGKHGKTMIRDNEEMDRKEIQGEGRNARERENPW
jgi:hypothetical protein